MIVLTKEIEKYVKLQQTELQKLKCAANLNVAYDCLMECEIEDVKDAMSLIQGEKVPDPFNVLDIGCGAGGIDILIHRCVGNELKSKAILHLIDKDGENVVYGYREPKDAGFYNELALTRKFIESNGVPADDISTYDAGKGELPPEDVKFNLILSLKSCGFHYPVNPYLKIFSEQIAEGGVILLDIRNGGSAKVLDRMFTRRMIGKYQKHERRAYFR